MQSCGKTRSMSTSQAREINNNEVVLTILCLRNVSRKGQWNNRVQCGNRPSNQRYLKLKSL